MVKEKYRVSFCNAGHGTAERAALLVTMQERSGSIYGL